MTSLLDHAIDDVWTVSEVGVGRPARRAAIEEIDGLSNCQLIELIDRSIERKIVAELEELTKYLNRR